MRSLLLADSLGSVLGNITHVAVVLIIIHE